MTTVPKEWMPDASMKRIHVHWTAGNHTASSNDTKHYHILIEGSGKLVRGDHSIKGNEKSPPLVSHTKKANTGAIGVSMCCMAKAQESPFNAGTAPMTKVEWDRMIEVVADLARKYAIPVTPLTVLTHAEVQPNLGIAQEGKWDVTRLAFDPSIKGAKAVGDRMRLEVAVALGKSQPAPPTKPPADMKLPRFRVSGVKPETLNFRAGPDGEVRGALPEGTVVERFAMFGIWSQVRTPAGHVGWVASSFLQPV
jgi:hypothetical protein